MQHCACLHTWSCNRPRRRSTPTMPYPSNLLSHHSAVLASLAAYRLLSTEIVNMEGDIRALVNMLLRSTVAPIHATLRRYQRHLTLIAQQSTNCIFDTVSYLQYIHRHRYDSWQREKEGYSLPKTSASSGDTSNRSLTRNRRQP